MLTNLDYYNAKQDKYRDDYEITKSYEEEGFENYSEMFRAYCWTDNAKEDAFYKHCYYSQIADLMKYEYLHGEKAAYSYACDEFEMIAEDYIEHGTDSAYAQCSACDDYMNGEIKGYNEW